MSADRSAMSDFDTRDFRNALGSFATGIAVISTRSANGELAGLTVNSFASVSLDPPLVLWSLSLYSPSLAVFQNCSHYAINILSAGQVELSKRFSRPSDAQGTGYPEGKFAGLGYDQGRGGAPLLRDCCAWFECRNDTRHAGGDHLIFVGLVEQYRRAEQLPLLFHGGQYCTLAPKD